MLNKYAKYDDETLSLLIKNTHSDLRNSETDVKFYKSCLQKQLEEQYRRSQTQKENSNV